MPRLCLESLRLGLLAVVLTSSVLGLAADQLYAPMANDMAKTRVLDWAATQGLQDKSVIEGVGKLWASSGDLRQGDELLNRAIQTFAMVNEDVNALVAKCQFGVLHAPEIDAAKLQKLDPFVAANVRAFVVRFDVQAGFYDESIQAADTVDPALLIDPASYLFFKAVAEQRLLRKSDGLATLKLLRTSTANVPARYLTVAELMEKDLSGLEEKTLNEVARMMSDVERRLGLGRSGERVQKVEDDIISRLDEIIKKLEDQAKGGGGAGGGKGGQQNQAQAPSQDSRIKGTTAPGEVDQRDIGKKSGWGTLPPKEQAKAKNLIDRELPPHYRNAIEQYLKKLATRPEGTPKGK